MSSKRHRDPVTGLLDRYAEWRKRRLAASCEAPLKTYLLKMGFIALFLVADFLLVPSIYFNFFPATKTTAVILAMLLIPLIFSESKLLNRGNAEAKRRRD
jgi:hypothetical protein